MSQKTYYTYIMASRKNGALYIGVTSDLEGRVWDHKNGQGSAHVKRYKIFNLVFYEEFQSINDAIDNEKRNPHWDDLSENF